MIGPLAVLGLWQLVCSLGVFTRSRWHHRPGLRRRPPIEGPGRTAVELADLPKRVAEGLAVEISVGVVLAVLSGLFRVGEDLLDPVVHMARSVPILGLLPLAIIWFGVGETPKIFLIALGTTFPIYLNTYAGIRGVDVKLVEAGQTFGLSRWGWCDE